MAWLLTSGSVAACRSWIGCASAAIFQAIPSPIFSAETAIDLLLDTDRRAHAEDVAFAEHHRRGVHRLRGLEGGLQDPLEERVEVRRTEGGLGDPIDRLQHPLPRSREARGQSEIDGSSAASKRRSSGSGDGRAELALPAAEDGTAAGGRIR